MPSSKWIGFLGVCSSVGEMLNQLIFFFISMYHKSHFVLSSDTFELAKMILEKDERHLSLWRQQWRQQGHLLSQWFQLGNPAVQLPWRAAEPTSAHWRTPLPFQFSEPQRSLPVINTPQVWKGKKKKKIIFMNLGTFMTGGEERHLSAVRGWFPLLLQRCAQFTGFCNCWICIDPHDHLKLSLTRAGSAVTSISFVY